MGLLDGNLDPQTMAQLQLAGGLLSPGSFGQGLQRGVTGYQGALAGAQDMQLKQQQIAEAIQQQKIRDIQLQQQTRMFDLQTPFLQRAVDRMNGLQSPMQAGPSATPNTPDPSAGLGAPGMPKSAPQSAPAPQQQGAAPQQSGSIFPGVSDDAAFGVIGTGGFSKLPDMIMKANEPTDLMKTMRAAGIDPNSAIGRQILQNNLAKTNYIAPQNARPGSIVRDPITQQPIAFNPHIPEGGAPVFDGSGNVTGINQINGATDVMRAGAAASAGGKAQFTPISGFDATGRPAPLTSVASALAPGQQPAPATQGIAPTGSADSIKEQIRVVRSNGGQPITAEMQPGIDAEVQRLQNQLLKAQGNGGSMYATPPLGAATGADFQQTDLGKRYSALRDQNTQAQTTNSYLQSIKQLADTASTGQFSDRLKFVNSLLSTAGVSDKATDSVTANNLLDKYSNQIVARLGQGGLGTDSARAILQSAYPNAHMTPQAIHEAADNLIGANDMVKAKMNLLAPAGNSKDPVGYQQKEQTFDQAADPRIWQLKNMTPQQATTFLASMPPAVRADLQQRAKVLKGLGAL